MGAIQLEKDKFIQNYKVSHKHASMVNSISYSLNSEYMVSVAADETNVWQLKSNMV